MPVQSYPDTPVSNTKLSHGYDFGNYIFIFKLLSHYYVITELYCKVLPLYCITLPVPSLLWWQQLLKLILAIKMSFLCYCTIFSYIKIALQTWPPTYWHYSCFICIAVCTLWALYTKNIHTGLSMQTQRDESLNLV